MKSFNNKKINKNIPTIEYYEWKKLYYKSIVLNKIKTILNKKNKSAYF